jgi:hypothetical protein
LEQEQECGQEVAKFGEVGSQFGEVYRCGLGEDSERMTDDVDSALARRGSALVPETVVDEDS